MKLPIPIEKMPVELCRNLAGILADIDDTLTTHGKLLSCALQALENAKRAGLMVVVVTGRPAGWVDHIARMWPVDGVIGENGAFYFHMERGKLRRRFLQPERERCRNRRRLQTVAAEILRAVPGARLASDQAYRECDLAIDYCEDVRALGKQSVAKIQAIFARHGATAKLSSIHINGWYGAYDKLQMTKKFLREVKGIDLARRNEKFLFFGDSPNDEPLFAFFTHGVGVANVRRFLPLMRHPPAWITKKVCSQGFSDAITAILKKRAP